VEVLHFLKGYPDEIMGIGKIRVSTNLRVLAAHRQCRIQVLDQEGVFDLRCLTEQSDQFEIRIVEIPYDVMGVWRGGRNAVARATRGWVKG